MSHARVMAPSAGELRWCAECTDERHFEVPPCEDGHGLDCLDLACVDCGFAIVSGLLLEQDPAMVELAAA